jgi:hypothetical protein
MVLAWRRRWREALLIVLPLVVLWMFNAIDRWPMGAFRTNVFTLGYMAAIAGMAFDVPSEGRIARWFWALPTLVMVILPIAVFEQVWHARKQAFTYDSRFPNLLQRMAAIRQTRGKAPLILDRRSCDPWKFYTRFHPKTSRELAPILDKSYDAFCIKNDAKIPEELLARTTQRQATWIILHVGHNLDKLARSGQLWPLGRVSRFEVGPHTVMSFRRRNVPTETNP